MATASVSPDGFDTSHYPVQMTPELLQSLASEHGTPLVAVDHDALRQNYADFQRHLPGVQVYYAVKANPDPAIIKTLYQQGASFDVASLAEFMLVADLVKDLPMQAQQAGVILRLKVPNTGSMVERMWRTTYRLCTWWRR